MKIPTPRQLPSGSWYVRVMVDGRSVSITRDTEKEAVAAAMQIKAGKETAPARSALTLSGAIDNYIESRENVLSPSTVRGYRAIQRTRFQAHMNRRIGDMTADQWQRAVNAEAKLCNAKTLTNSWRFISSVIHDVTGRRISVRLPQIVSKDLLWLDKEQIPIFLEAARGHACEMTALLALSSLRRSEICALRWENIDIEHGCIHVNGSAVLDNDGNLVVRKENKNSTSRRTIPFLLPRIRELYEESDTHTGLVVKHHINSTYGMINSICRRCGLPEVGVHGLRRSFASLALFHLKLPEDVVMRIGGWSDIYTMRKIYTKLSESEILRRGKEYESFFSFL